MNKRFLLVATDTMHRHLETWRRRHIPDDAHCYVTDVTSGYAQINIQGPRSRELLKPLTSADLGNAAFPFRTAREGACRAPEASKHDGRLGFHPL